MEVHISIAFEFLNSLSRLQLWPGPGILAVRPRFIPRDPIAPMTMQVKEAVLDKYLHILQTVEDCAVMAKRICTAIGWAIDLMGASGVASTALAVVEYFFETVKWLIKAALFAGRSTITKKDLAVSAHAACRERLPGIAQHSFTHSATPLPPAPFPPLPRARALRPVRICAARRIGPDRLRRPQQAQLRGYRRPRHAHESAQVLVVRLDRPQQRYVL